jgi:hypothetical protein
MGQQTLILPVGLMKAAAVANGAAQSFHHIDDVWSSLGPLLLAGPFCMRKLEETPMKTTNLIGLKLHHATAKDITGKITDVLFDSSLKEAGFIMADVTTPRGTAPVLFSPVVMSLDDEGIITTALPDDILARHEASMNRATLAVDPSDLPSTLVGPFGNTFSLSMIAALFNARVDGDKPDIPGDHDGVWMTELLDHPVRAHVADIGHVADMLLDEGLTHTQNVLIKTFAGAFGETPPEAVTVTKTADGQLVITISQDAAP